MQESPLPLECLRIVLANLAHTRHAQVLAALLRVNRFFAEATLPFLYAKPFHYEFHSFNGAPSKGEQHVLLARTLLRQAPPEKVTDLLRDFCFAKQDFDTDEDNGRSSLLESESYVPVLHYLPHIKTLLPATFPTNGLYSRDSHYYTSDRLASFLQTSGLKKHYPPIALSRSYDIAQYDHLFGQALRTDVERDFTWALCVPETIQNLTISVMDCKRYFEQVEQFKVLANIQFSFEAQLQVDAFSSQEEIPEQVTGEQERRKEREENVDTMIAFVQEHTRIHRKVLRTAKCVDSKLWLSSDEYDPDNYQFRLFKLLPPLHNPTVLDEETIQQFCMNSDDTNLDFVESITTSGVTTGLKDILATLSRSICRCRALRHICIDLHEDDLFQWATKEKQEYDRQVSNGQVPTRPLVPVESACLQFGKAGYGPQIDSFVQGFGDTLNSLDVYGRFLIKDDGVPIGEPVVCGRQWNLPALVRLTVVSFNAPLILDPDALSRCPVLMALDLKDCMPDLRHTDNISSWPPVALPHLWHLTLMGTSARIFHPDTLHSTSDLETLCLSMNHIRGQHSIPPVQELQHLLGQEANESRDELEDTPGIPQLPIWTWDWHLPQLKELVMTAEFAFCFQFKMLRQTPLLRSFHLNSSTRTGLHERTVTLDELRDNEAGRGGFIRLPKLLEFRLMGHWKVGSQVWKTIFGQIAPNIQTVEEMECSGFELEDWVEATLLLKSLVMSHTTLAADDDELLAQGLAPVQNGFDMYDDTVKPEARHYFQGSAYQFVSPSEDPTLSQIQKK
ncbi:MAG: hypothetical protein JOS17DRAFT_833691 [Linnemannia elongata]|nr:MAG: hypothetical protein JOS17DRAFT_833691 [Linnemannia elongata]